MIERYPCATMASGRNGTIYTGVTSNPMARVHQHRTGATPGFIRGYGVVCLVHFEQLDDMPSAIAREKQLKNRQRDWKCNLIERRNPHWDDLAVALGFAPLDRPGRAVDPERRSG